MLTKIVSFLTGLGLIFMSMSLSVVSLKGLIEILKVLDIVGLAIVIAMSTAVNYFNVIFDGAFRHRTRAPKNIFLLFFGLAIFQICYTMIFTSESLHYDIMLTGAALSIFMTWYGFCLLFGTFFAGKNFALFFLNPFALIFQRIKRNANQMGRK
jgi:hypothetical protein